MMQIKKLLSLLLCLILSLCIGLAAACGGGGSNDDEKGGDDTNQDDGSGDGNDGEEDTTNQLAAPKITLNGSTISWKIVKNADGYEVYEGTTQVSTQEETSYTIDKNVKGTYKYTVYATSTDSTYKKSKASNTVEYVIDGSLASPVVTLSGSTMSWSAVPDAVGYDIYEGSTKLKSNTATELSYTIDKAAVGTYYFNVVALTDDTVNHKDSKASNTVAYRVKGEDTSVTLNNKIYVVGDSTVSAFSDDYYLPRYGYGTQLFNYFNLSSSSNIVNLALSGRSSLSFLGETNYNTLKTSISEGDYLIIGFGHNDEKSDDADRFTEPKGDYKTPTTNGKPSFQYTLYENYVKLAKEKGATPILCTPIVRYAADGVYDNKSVSHVTSDGDYAAAIKKLGQDTNTAVVDLTSITKEYYKAHNEDAKYFHAYTTYAGEKPNETPDGIDATHINKYGAKMIAFWLATNLPDDCSLKNHVKGDADVPHFDVDFPDAIKTSYKRPEYSGFNPAKNAARKVDTIGDGDWYHTAMGVLGGANNASQYKFEHSDGTYTITTGNGSKFASSQDGFGAIFTQIDIDYNFTISLKAKIISAPSSVSDQNAFGIMLRDDIYIDSNITTIVSNFVSASVTGKGNANMSRIDTKLAYGGSVSYATDTEYELTLTRVGQVVTATVKVGETIKTTTFTDISFVGIDGDYAYLCLFANRELKVEFSDISFEITGEAQGA